MRTISLREPVARAMMIKGAAIVGKNWPASKREENVYQLRGPVGLQVSKQGQVKDLAAQMKVIERCGLGGACTHPVPRGSVIAAGHVSDVFPGNWAVGKLVAAVSQSLRGYGYQWTLDQCEAWLELACAGNKYRNVRWYYVIVGVRAVKPFPWRGVMSQFPVPDAAFKYTER